MADRDKMQGFAFKIGDKLYNFVQPDEITLAKKVELSEDGIRYEIEKIMADAFELLEAAAHDPEDILDMLIEDLEYLKNNKS